jgi:hypothetical protein
LDEAEAASILATVVAEVRSQGYAGLVRRYLDSEENTEVPGASGAIYQVEVQAFWDDPRQRGDNLRVIVSIDDGSFLRATLPKASSFVVAPDGTFVGE